MANHLRLWFPLIFVKVHQTKDTATQGTLDHCVDGEMNNKYLSMIPLMTMVSCSWLLWNKEARYFFYRKCASFFTCFSTRRKRRIDVLPRRLIPPSTIILVEEFNHNWNCTIKINTKDFHLKHCVLNNFFLHGGPKFMWFFFILN